MPSLYFAVWASDKPDALERRKSVREAHRARLRDSGDPTLQVVIAGPTRDEGSEEMNGTLLIVRAADIEAVRRFVANDPYTLAGVYAQVDIRPWDWGLGQPSNQGNS